MDGRSSSVYACQTGLAFRFLVMSLALIGVASARMEQRSSCRGILQYIHFAFRFLHLHHLVKSSELLARNVYSLHACHCLRSMHNHHALMPSIHYIMLVLPPGVLAAAPINALPLTPFCCCVCCSEVKSRFIGHICPASMPAVLVPWIYESQAPCEAVSC